MDYSLEKSLQSQGYSIVAGCDEAGRGPMAGPIVAGAVVFDEHILEFPKFCEIINDSKKLTEKKRDQLFSHIMRYAVSWSVGIILSNDIDEYGIAWANHECVKRAIKNLTIIPDYILSDYIPKLEFDVPSDIIKKGDATVLSIAAASIVAKVTRDRMMYDYHKKFPEYGFAKHKGYGTKGHRDAIEEFGLTDIHRKTFTFNK